MLSCGLPLASANAYHALGVVIPCRLLFRGLFLASANAYRALGVVIVLSYVVLWSASGISFLVLIRGLVRPSLCCFVDLDCWVANFPMTTDVHRYYHRIGTSYSRVVSIVSVVCCPLQFGTSGLFLIIS